MSSNHSSKIDYPTALRLTYQSVERLEVSWNINLDIEVGL